MILKGNRRGGAKDLALHLVKEENDHAELHELRGFASSNLMGALNETYAISKGTRCKKFMYSMSINPPPGEKVSTADILEAVEKSEKSLKLTGQPRAIVFHEKEGRRHAHVVWSLIDAREMKAVRLRYDREKLQPLTRDLFIQHSWKMPDGLLDPRNRDPRNRDPRNFTLKEYRQARKHDRNPRAVKTAIQTAWAISDSRAVFSHALEERGFKLAKGDRAGIVCVDTFGEVYAVPKMLGVRIKVVREKIGNERNNPENFLSVDEAKEKTASLMLSALNRFKGEIAITERGKTGEFERRKKDLIRRQRLERASLEKRQQERWEEESRMRHARFRCGLKGLWDGLRGHNRRIRKANEFEALEALERDQNERDALVHSHLDQRCQINLFKMSLRQEFTRERRHIERDIRTYQTMRLGHGQDEPGP